MLSNDMKSPKFAAGPQNLHKAESNPDMKLVQQSSSALMLSMQQSDSSSNNAYSQSNQASLSGGRRKHFMLDQKHSQ
jgi:hypothetical protein